MPSLNGKVGIVTGASNGIGRAIAERLAKDGALVIVNYGKSADKAKSVVSGIESIGGNAVAIQADVSRVADVRRLVKRNRPAVWTTGHPREQRGHVHVKGVGRHNGRGV